jgi:hypothetical protein
VLGASAVSNADGNGVLSIAGRAASPAGDMSAALWNATASGTLLSLTNLVPVPFTNPGGVAVNDDSMIVLTRPASVFVPSLGVISLTLNGSSPLASEAYGINNLGDVVGTVYDNDAGHSNGALWTVDGQGNIAGPVNLGGFWPQDINDLGMMAGNFAGFAAVAEFDEERILQVHSLGSLVATDSSSQAWAINNWGKPFLAMAHWRPATRASVHDFTKTDGKKGQGRPHEGGQ